MRQQAKDRHGGMSARIRTPRPRKVVVAVRMGNATGRQRLRGVYRYLAQNGDWDVQLVRTESELTAEYVRQACADGAEGFLVLFHPDAETHAELMSAKRPVATFAGDSANDTPKVFLRLPDENNILIGETADLIRTSLERNGFTNFEYAGSLGEAVQKARASAEGGWNVLLSPACASFDMFRDYEERGRVFKEIVNGLK